MNKLLHEFPDMVLEQCGLLCFDLSSLFVFLIWYQSHSRRWLGGLKVSRSEISSMWTVVDCVPPGSVFLETVCCSALNREQVPVSSALSCCIFLVWSEWRSWELLCNTIGGKKIHMEKMLMLFVLVQWAGCSCESEHDGRCDWVLKCLQSPVPLTLCK